MSAVVVTRDQPGLWWVTSLLFASLGALFVYLGLFGSGDMPTWQALLAAGMGLVGVGVGLWLAWNAPLSTVAIDAATRTLHLTQHGLFGRRVRLVPVATIADVIVQHRADDDGDVMARPALVLKDGEVVPLSALWRHDPDGMARVAERVRAATV